MTYKLCLSLLGLLACGGPKIPQQPLAKGVVVTVDTSGPNPVISWTPYSSRATSLLVSSDCAYGPQKVLIDQPTIYATGGTEHLFWWLFPGKDNKMEGFDGPVVFGSNVPGTSVNIPPHDLSSKCKFIVQVGFPDNTHADSKPVKLDSSTAVAKADQQMKAAGLDKPWVSMKPAAKPVEVPPPDEAAQAKVAGRYELVSIGGKPLPYDYGNGCKMTSVWLELDAAGTFKTGYTMSCTTGPLTMGPTSGKYGVAGDKVMMSDSSEAVVTADGLTKAGPGGVYLMKKK